MEQWPGNPIATMVITEFPYNVSIIPSSASAKQRVIGGSLEFVINIQYNNSSGGGRGLFVAEIFKETSAGSTSGDLQSKVIGGGTGTVNDTLILTINMTSTIEDYLIVLKCANEGSPLTTLNPSILLHATQFVSVQADLTISFVPVSIVYCPPGQDMTNSLTQSKTFGTRFSLGFTSTLGWNPGYSSSYSHSGDDTHVDSTTNAQTSVELQEGDMQISHSTNTIITADNQKAIGRAYWGPLGDLFVILANINIGVGHNTDGSTTYYPNLDGGEQVLIIPAWKLLRPGTDSIASSIPDDTRKNILSLDPFITNLDKFFPDSGADLSEAANPYADPTANNRAELIGRWWLDTGVEVNYSVGNTYQQSFIDTNELTQDFTTGSLVQSVSSPNKDWTTSIQKSLDSQTDTNIAYQQSAETDSSVISNAACFLIRNQNDYDLDGIAVYYDKTFSTFMFQRLNSGKLWVPPPTILKNRQKANQLLAHPFATIMGAIHNWQQAPLRGMQVYLQNANGKKFQTSSNINGHYSFYNLEPGKYILTAGDKKANIVVKRNSSPINPNKLNLSNVRRVINFKKSPAWEIAAVLQMPTDKIRKMRKKVATITNENMLLKVTGYDKSFLTGLKKEVALPWELSKKKTGKKEPDIDLDEKRDMDEK